MRSSKTVTQRPGFHMSTKPFVPATSVCRRNIQDLVLLEALEFHPEARAQFQQEARVSAVSSTYFQSLDVTTTRTSPSPGQQHGDTVCTECS
mmetsp:Transcript_18980/g.33727  ORF Transcript_18980/g.33727 Transcript_18980/m.33727 type:complete len:92 (-) Transcript_18980:248-523(-)